MLRYVLLLFFVWLSCLEKSQAQIPDGQLIGVSVEDVGLMKHHTYTYARSEPVDVMQVLPVVAANGTPNQQRRAKRLLRSQRVGNAVFGAALVSVVSGGFFGEPQLRTRQVATLGGSGLMLLSVLPSIIQEKRARRLVQAYNDTLLAETAGYVRSYIEKPYLTLADTVAIAGNQFSYRGLDGVLPTRTPGFDWKRERPRFGVAETIGLGLAFVGSLAMSITSFAATQPGDYRRFAWAGAGVTTVAVGLAIPIGRQNQTRQLNAIRRYNQFVRDRS